MANAKELRKRIKSVTNTKKITRTMEMVAASKLKRALDQVQAAQPYFLKLKEILSELTKGADSAMASQYPLLQQRPVKRVMIFLLTANRGLCGAYNSSLIRLARRTFDEQRAQGREVEFHIAGRKGLQFFRFRKYEIAGAYTDLAERPGFADADAYAQIATEAFLSGRVDQVIVISAQFKSALSQPATAVTLLPISPDSSSSSSSDAATGADGKSGYRHDFILTPSADVILGKLFPMYVRYMFYRTFVEAVASEHSARRVAMKSATDNADEMITNLTRVFNRARQAAITQEISEIVGGAAALE
ncbi:MAG: ATP synthase F1 subunit gamma [Planctomycetota bacterium]